MPLVSAGRLVPVQTRENCGAALATMHLSAHVAQCEAHRRFLICPPLRAFRRAYAGRNTAHSRPAPLVRQARHGPIIAAHDQDRSVGGIEVPLAFCLGRDLHGSMASQCLHLFSSLLMMQPAYVVMQDCGPPQIGEATESLPSDQTRGENGEAGQENWLAIPGMPDRAMPSPWRAT
jgi:hypothetical protein